MRKTGFIVIWLCLVTLAAGAGAAEPAFVRVSPRDPRYFELTDGLPYIPIGFDLVSAPRENELDTTLKVMAANKVNYCRVWLDQSPWSIEEKPGVYDTGRARVLRRFLDLAAARGIRVKLCIEYFRDVQPARNKWTDNPALHRDNGGPFVSMEDYLYSPEGQAGFRRKLAFYREQIGDHPGVFAWELWNEMNAVHGDWVKWTETMLPELHRLFPKNMAVQSLGSFDNDRARGQYRTLVALGQNDVAQVHRYLDPGAPLKICQAPMDLLAADAVRELLAMKPGKPVILAESGAVKPRHTGCSELYARDKDGILLHDIIFTPFFTGAAGTGHAWWWNECIRRPDQWHQFARFAHAVEGIDPAAENFEPLMIEHPRLRVYLLKGRTTLLGWCRDIKSDWPSELERGEVPETLKGMKLDLGPVLQGATAGPARAYSPWGDAWGDVPLNQGALELPEFRHSIVIKVGLSKAANPVESGKFMKSRRSGMSNVKSLGREVSIGGQPTEADLRQWAAEGVRAVVNLVPPGEIPDALQPDPEGRLARELGMAYLNLPVPAKNIYSTQAVEEFTKSLGQLPRPLVVHCRSGWRAGVYAAIALGVEQKLSGAEALSRVRQLGFDPGQGQPAEFIIAQTDGYLEKTERGMK